jgi:hypothetical protein
MDGKIRGITDCQSHLPIRVPSEDQPPAEGYPTLFAHDPVTLGVKPLTPRRDLEARPYGRPASVPRPRMNWRAGYDPVSHIKGRQNRAQSPIPSLFLLSKRLSPGYIGGRADKGKLSAVRSRAMDILNVVQQDWLAARRAIARELGEVNRKAHAGPRAHSPATNRRAASGFRAPERGVAGSGLSPFLAFWRSETAVGRYAPEACLRSKRPRYPLYLGR